MGIITEGVSTYFFIKMESSGKTATKDVLECLTT